MATVLVVEDERKLRDLLRSYLERDGHAVVSAGNGADGLRLATTVHPDLIILDLGLPDITGEAIAAEVRASSSVPIVILTARAEEADRIRGLELGADDYVTKPFSPRELLLRVRAILRRGVAQREVTATHSYGDGRLVIDDRDAGGDGRRHGGDAHADRVGHPHRAGDNAGAGVQPRRADQSCPRARVRGLRAQRRLAREEPAPQDRGRPGEPVRRS